MLGISRHTFLAVLLVDLLASSGDIAQTWTSPVLPKLYSNDSDVNPFDRTITSDEESWIGSLMSIGAMIGPFPYGFIAEKFGRKISLLCIVIPHIISYLTFAFSKTVYLYYFGRILNGLAIGGGYTLLPIYIAEVTEACNRGMFSTTLNIFWSIGNLIPYTVGPYLSVFWFNIILACITTISFCLFLVVAPETPYFLAMKGRTRNAEKTLMKLRSKNEKLVQDELAQIRVELQKNREKVPILDFFKSRTYMKGLGIAIFLIVAQQLSGVSAILFYTQEIFEDAGATALSPEVSSMVIGAVGLVSSFEAPLVADRAGRRILLLISSMGVCFTHLSFGVYFYLQSSTTVDVTPISWLPLVSLVAYCLIFNLGIGALPWTLASELFPTSVKHYAGSLVSFSCWTASFIVTRFFIDLKEGLGQGGTFWMFSGFSFVAFLFTFFFVPETKGRSFQEIQEILDGKRATTVLSFI